jgi:ubiquinone/menaquinone biosynthesis C-methylase UbiE
MNFFPTKSFLARRYANGVPNINDIRAAINEVYRLSRIEAITSLSVIASFRSTKEGCATISISGKRINAIMIILLETASHIKGSICFLAIIYKKCYCKKILILFASRFVEAKS